MVSAHAHDRRVTVLDDDPSAVASDPTLLELRFTAALNPSPDTITTRMRTLRTDADRPVVGTPLDHRSRRRFVEDHRKIREDVAGHEIDVSPRKRLDRKRRVEIGDVNDLEGVDVFTGSCRATDRTSRARAKM